MDASLASLQGIVQHATMLLLLVYRVGRRMPIADQQNVLDYPALHWATASIENDARNSDGVGAGKMNRDVAECSIVEVQHVETTTVFTHCRVLTRERWQG